MVNIGTYFSHLRELVALELREEQQAYQRSLAAKGASLTGSIHEPACRYPVRLGNTAYNPLGQLTLELRYEVEEDEVELDFEPGKPVTLFHLAGDTAKELPHQCYVEAVGDGVMSVSLPSKAALQSLKDLSQRHLIGVQLGAASRTPSSGSSRHRKSPLSTALREPARPPRWWKPSSRPLNAKPRCWSAPPRMPPSTGSASNSCGAASTFSASATR